jgi:hypothetical protein
MRSPPPAHPSFVIRRLITDFTRARNCHGRRSYDAPVGKYSPAEFAMPFVAALRGAANERIEEKRWRRSS